MSFVMLIAGIGLVVAGLLAIGFGIPIKEFSTGNTLIMAGVISICTGVIMFGLWVAVRELKNIARRIGTGLVVEGRDEAAVRPEPAAAVREPAPAEDDFAVDDPFVEPRARPPEAPPAFSPAVPPPWQNEAVLRDHPIPEPLHPEPTPPEAKPKRNLMFSSTSRKERERALGRSSEALPPDLVPPDLRSRPAVDTAEPPQAFEDSWPRADRAKPDDTLPPRRGVRLPSMPAKAGPMRVADQPEVMVLKSGIVDGMAYSLYSDGSIEAQMPEGMMRFASIDELRVHLDQRS
jgi:hypothetical protein